MNEQTKITAKHLLSGEIGQVSLDLAYEGFLQVGLEGRAPKTIRWYREKLASLVTALGPDRPLIDVMEGDLLDWKSNLNGISRFTLHGYVRATRRFFSWLKKKGVIEDNPARYLEFPKLPKVGRKGISEKDLKMILNAAQAHVRDYALLRFMESTGCRLGGIENLLLSDLNLDSDDPRIRRRVTVREKGDKERSVFLTNGALSVLEAWLEERPDCDTDHVFLGQTRDRKVWKPLRGEGIYEVVRKYATISGAKKPWSPHHWRHRFARRLLQEGLDLARVSQIMGHTTVQVTVEFYGQFVVDQLQEGFDRFMPDD